MAVCVACMAIYWPTPGFKVWTFKLFVVIIWDFNFCVRCSPLRDCLILLSTSWLGSKHQLTNKLNCSHPFVSQDLQVRIFVFSVLPFCRTDKKKKNICNDQGVIPLTSTLMECCPVSSKLIVIRLMAVAFNITVIQAYAPSSDYEQNEVETFCD